MDSDEGVQHADGTTHFRCACGQNLLFAESSASTWILSVTNYQREANLKKGECPKCGRAHRAHIHPVVSEKSKTDHP